MIPRILHFVWLSGDSYPSEIQSCIDSWHKWMPDWKFELWNMSRVKDINSPWLKEAIAEQKWAFATDFIRLFAVVNYGGVYLDSDCRVYRSFDSLLDQPSFIGKEWMIHDEGFTTEQHLTSHCFGAVSNHPFFQRCLDYYKNRHFIVSVDKTLPDSLRFDMKIMPKIQSELARQIGYNPSPYSGEQYLPDGLHIYPSDYFNPCGRNKLTYCEHLCWGSWRSCARTKVDKVTISYSVRYHIDEWLRKLMDRWGYVLFKKLQ